MKGLYLNTPPKPKQARTVELQEAEQQELEVDRSREEENISKRRKGEQRTGGCNGVEVREGAGGRCCMVRMVSWSRTNRGSHGAELT